MDQNEFDEIVCNGYWDEEQGVHFGGHPDALEIAPSKDFNEWAKAEKIDIEAVSDPKEAIRIISLYKWAKYVQGFLPERWERPGTAPQKAPEYKKKDFLLKKKSCSLFFQALSTHFREPPRQDTLVNYLSNFRRTSGHGTR